MPFRMIKKEGIIFTTGVICGFLIRSLMAKSSPEYGNNVVSEKDEISSEEYVEIMKDRIENGEKPPTAAKMVGDIKILPECFMKVPEIIKHAGYPLQEYTVTTEDGYKLGLHRIPHGKLDRTEKSKRSSSYKPVVFLQHGLLADSANWVSNGPDKSLAFLLADFGCDVWLGNVRGNTYSRQHENLDPDVDERFWRYSWQQFSEFDLPAMVNFALKETGNEKLYYVGHSQGSLIMFARLAEDPEFNNKIALFIGVGPVFNLQSIKSPIKHLVHFHNTLEMGHWMLGGAELLRNTEAGKWLASQLHSWVETNPQAKYHGENVMLNIAGFNPSKYCKERLPVYLAHTPAGTSIQNIIHFAQMIATNKTCKYSFESEETNIEVYGTPTPPCYDLGSIRAPIALFWGSEDWFADPDDVLSIIPQLKTLVRTKELKGWDHLEFLYGEEAAENLYKEIAEMIQENENKRERKNLRADL